MTMADWRPLKGIRILDLTRMLPGATATRVLSDLGATVVKIESLLGDETRYLMPRVGEDSSAQHQYVDRDKESVRLNLKNPDDLQTALDLASGVDAVIESFRPGVADRLGVGFEALAKLRPGLVYVSLSGYGSYGARKNAAGHDLNFMGYSGLGDGAPSNVLVGDVSGGMLAATAIASGVLQARAGADAVHIDLALADAALFAGGMRLAADFASVETGAASDPLLDGNIPCYRTYAASDGQLIAVGAIEEKFWKRVVDALGHPEWFERQQDPDLVPEVSAAFATRSRAEWMAELEGDDTCVTPVLQPGDVLTDPHIQTRASVIRRTTPAGDLWQVASPFRDITPSESK